jgi:hypothetical protein
VLLLVPGLSMVTVAIARNFQTVYTPPACQTVTFHTEPQLYAQRVCMNVGVRTHGTEPGTYLFLTPDQTGVGIYTSTGTLVWWEHRPVGDENAYDAQVVDLFRHPYLAVWAGSHKAFGTNGVYVNRGTVLLYNERYQQVGEITAGRPFSPDTIDAHEFRMTPDGHALVGIYVPIHMRVDGHLEYVINYVVQELSLVRGPNGIHTGKVLFQWSALTHVPLPETYLPDPGPNGGYDYFHGNSIAQDSDGNFLISGRNTWGIYKVSAKTGRILWQVGGKGDVTLPHPWCYQHDITPLGNGEYSIFDDGAEGPDCMRQTTWHQSRALFFRVQPTPGSVRLTPVKAYKHVPRAFSEFVGGAQVLSDRNVLVDWGTVPEISEFSPTGSVLMDLSLSYASYRGFRAPWVGQPTAPPAAAAQLKAGGTEVWASWNGSTEVSAWRALGGATASTATISLGPPVPKRGFETSLFVKPRYPFVAVQALSASGQVLATSKPVAATSG